jgi:hypothetical protein
MERITHRAIPARCKAPGGIGCRDGCNAVMLRLAQFLVGELGEVCCADHDDGGAHLACRLAGCGLRISKTTQRGPVNKSYPLAADGAFAPTTRFVRLLHERVAQASDAKHFSMPGNGSHLPRSQKRRTRHRCQDQDGGDVGYVGEGHGCTGGAGRGVQ